MLIRRKIIKGFNALLEDLALDNNLIRTIFRGLMEMALLHEITHEGLKALVVIVGGKKKFYRKKKGLIGKPDQCDPKKASNIYR